MVEMMADWLGFMPRISTMLLLLILLAAIIWPWVKSQQKKKKLPPGLPSLPIVGSIPFLGLKGEDDHLRYEDLAKKYGSVYSFWLGNKLVVVLNGYDVIKAALLGQSANFAGRPFMKHSPLMKCVNPDLLGIAEGSNTREWKKERMVSLAILKDSGFGRNVMESRIQVEVDSLVSHIQQLDGAPFDPKEALDISVSNLIGAIVLGKRFPIDDCQRLKNILQAMEAIFKLYLELLPLNVFPVLAYLPSFKKAMAQYTDNQSRVRDFLMEFIKKEEAANHEGRGDDDNFIGAFINRMREEYKTDHLLYIIRDLFLAGTETSSTTLQWALVYMANNPHIQERVQEELDGEIGRRPARMEDSNRLPYTQAVLMELQRTAAVVPLSLPHENGQDTDLCGHHIPADTMVMINLWSVLRDPELWPEPDQFRPERFLDDSGTVHDRPELIPFSLGRRSCLGDVLAKQELFLFFCALMQNFSIHTPPGSGKLDEGGKVFSTRIPARFQIVAKPRK